MSIGTCHHCPKRTAVIDGQIRCTVDGRTIQDHVAEDVCPHGRFGTIGMLPPLAGKPDIPISPAAPRRSCCGE